MCVRSCKCVFDNVYVYNYAFVSVRVCVYTVCFECRYAKLYICIHKATPLCLHNCICACIYVCVYVCLCKCVCVGLCVYVDVRALYAGIHVQCTFSYVSVRA